MTDHETKPRKADPFLAGLLYVFAIVVFLSYFTFGFGLCVRVFVADWLYGVGSLFMFSLITFIIGLIAEKNM